MLTRDSNGDATIKLAGDDYYPLLMILGAQIGHAFGDGSIREAWKLTALVNRINEGNPEFTPYQIPEEYSRC